MISHRTKPSDAICECGHPLAVHQGPQESCAKCYGCEEFRPRPKRSWADAIWFVVYYAAVQFGVFRFLGVDSLWVYFSVFFGGVLLIAVVRLAVEKRRASLDSDSSPGNEADDRAVAESFRKGGGGLG